MVKAQVDIAPAVPSTNPRGYPHIFNDRDGDDFNFLAEEPWLEYPILAASVLEARGIEGYTSGIPGPVRVIYNGSAVPTERKFDVVYHHDVLLPLGGWASPAPDEDQNVPFTKATLCRRVRRSEFGAELS